MSKLVKYIIIFLISVFISSVSQIILKISANKTYDNKVKEYLNPFVIGAYSIFLLSTLLTMYAYKEVPLSMGSVIEATGYIYVTVLGAAVLKEKITKKKIIGNLIIIAGIIIYSL